jgi:tetratricopeptide (TPR) repeat protein
MMTYRYVSLVLIVALSCSMAVAAQVTPPTAHTPAPEMPPATDEPIRVGLGLAHKGDWQGAIAAFNRALALDPESGEALFFRGQAEAAHRDYPAALHSLATALHHIPHEPAIYQTIGEIHAARGDTDRAADALAIAADLYLRQEAPTAARQAIDRLREVKPDAVQLGELEERAAGGAARR